MEMISHSGLSITELLRFALIEDEGDGDHTSLSTIDAELHGSATVKVKEDGIISGLVVADHILNLVDSGCIVKVKCSDGDSVSHGQIVMEIEGKVRSLLKAERLLLNCMQRMSGIATLTRKFSNAIAGTEAKILDTRKTTPNFRVFEKWAVKTGGGTNHRFGLYDMILIKDNHVDAAGGIRKAIKKALDYLQETGRDLPIEIETRNIKEVEEVLEHLGVQRIMLDNFNPQLLRRAIELISHRIITEASGGIVLDNVKEYAETGVNFISVGALTHSYKSMDISMKLIK